MIQYDWMFGTEFTKMEKKKTVENNKNKLTNCYFHKIKKLTSFISLVREKKGEMTQITRIKKQRKEY